MEKVKDLADVKESPCSQTCSKPSAPISFPVLNVISFTQKEWQEIERNTLRINDY